MLSDQIDNAGGLLPVVWLDDLLRQELGELYARLPAHFSVAAFLFLIQRAEEEQSPFRNWEFRDLPKDERPDYRLGFAIGKAMVLAGFQPWNHPDRLLDRVLGFIGAGHFVRPWRDYGLTLRYAHEFILRRHCRRAGRHDRSQSIGPAARGS
jgi:hypothetical protein